ncbi:hypothetical protein JKP88DRAFT_244927 [Tribonema minus]|uniref:Uncharacterized protein n=1 Tax=Tribonema minus TaxID=303371 RepID=A0A835Z2X3_9STRA|nr:hypothetical protein JKP88DRAFT_244927 [Tribonema minus]
MAEARLECDALDFIRKVLAQYPTSSPAFTAHIECARYLQPEEEYWGEDLDAYKFAVIHPTILAQQALVMGLTVDIKVCDEALRRDEYGGYYEQSNGDRVVNKTPWTIGANTILSPPLESTYTVIRGLPRDCKKWHYWGSSVNISGLHISFTFKPRHSGEHVHVLCEIADGTNAMTTPLPLRASFHAFKSDARLNEWLEGTQFPHKSWDSRTYLHNGDVHQIEDFDLKGVKHMAIVVLRDTEFRTQRGTPLDSMGAPHMRVAHLTFEAM